MRKFENYMTVALSLLGATIIGYWLFTMAFQWQPIAGYCLLMPMLIGMYVFGKALVKTHLK